MIPGYSISEALKEDKDWRLLRCVRTEDNESVLVRIARDQAPDARLAKQLESEFGTLREISNPGISKVHDLVVGTGNAALVMEDPGGNLLNTVLVAGPLELADFLAIAVNITTVVAEMHKLGIVHTRLRPDVVFLGKNGNSVLISEFAFAVNLNEHEEKQHTLPDSNLSYMAPEQTGRIDANIDHRTDLYLLGVMFFEMLIGRPPFVAEDTLELIHCHIARMPQDPCRLNPEIPPAVSKIIMRLLRKKAGERYMSAQGIRADLQECVDQLRDTGVIRSFDLARQDRPGSFFIPDKLYGRAQELTQLRDSFDKLREKGPGLVLVAGYSGVGKTSLIQHIRGSVAVSTGYFCGGKYDQLDRSNPYGAILQAFGELLAQILTETDAEIAAWKKRILLALRDNAQVVIDVIPQLELIIGSQPPVPNLTPVDAQNRFGFYFQRFIGLFARPERPLVLFLDDLQWASVASIRLFHSWVTGIDASGLLIIGAYRDNEVDAAHPLRSVIREIREAGGEITEIELQPLDVDSIGELIQETLRCSDRESLSLAQCVHEKTDGNPFFARSFLRSLYEDGQLYLNEETVWQWNVDSINAAPAADNVVSLMVRKIERLPASTREAVKLAACLGNRFELSTLATVCGQNADAILKQLDLAISNGLIELHDEVFLTFYHDRVQEAAYGMILESQREEIHYQIGSMLRDNVNIGASDERVFEIVNHLNIGRALIDSPDERRDLAELNLRAGLKAKSSTAYGSAYDYFSRGVELLPDNVWEIDYATAFEMYRERSECAYLCSEFDEAEDGFSFLMSKARTNIEKGTIYNLRVIQYENLSRFADAAELGREGLALFDIHFPIDENEKLALVDTEIQLIQDSLVGKDVAELVNLPLMQDADMKVCMKLLMTIWAPNYISGDMAMTMLIAACLVRLSLQHGNTEESAYGYVTHGVNVAARMGDYEAAHQFGLLALSVNESLDDRTARAKINHMFSCYMGPWRGHIKDYFKYSRAGYEAGIDSGDFTYGGYSGFHESWHALFSGMNLERYAEEYSVKLQFLSGYKYQSIGDAHQLMLQWGRCLQGETAALLSLDGDEFTERSYLENYEDVPFFISFYYVAKLNTCYVLEDYRSAMRYAELAENVIFGVRGMIWDALLCFNHALVLAAVHDELDEKEKQASLKKLQQLRAKLRDWAGSSPQNYGHQVSLIEAEIARINDNHASASEHYELAILAAREQGFVNFEGLACELAGRSCLKRNRRSLAAAYFHDATECYLKWGATAKAQLLLTNYGELVSNLERRSTPAATLTSESLDVAAILKASQAISSEMVMDQLVEQLMLIVLEGAGAERGLLLCPEGDRWRVDALGVVDGGEVSVDMTALYEGLPDWSMGAVNYVSHTREFLLSGNAQLDNRLTGDNYVRENGVKSLLCVPIMHQQELTAILYLENNLIPNTFTSERALVVQALAAQAAIALKNARLYSDVVKEIGVRRKAETALRLIATGTASVTGEDFFHSLVQSLARSLDVKCVFVAECIGNDTRRVRTLAFMNEGKFTDNVEYEVVGTPCEAVVQGDAVYYPENLEKLYPCEKGFESYMGAPALDLSGRVLGHLAIVDTSDMRHLPHAESILRIFATRVGVELQRKETQDALRASEENYRLLVENQTDLVVKLDRSGKLLFISPSYCDTFSRSEAELRGTSFNEQIHAGDIERVEDEFAKLFVEPWTAEFEHRALTNTGTRWLGWALKALRDSAGEIIEIVGVGRDVTARRDAEEEARQNLHTLAHAGRMQSMGEMASTLAHELNQPLTAILSFSQASQRVIGNKNFDHDELVFALERIAANAKRAGDIISHMRGFVRKEEPRTEQSDVNILITEAMDLVNFEMQHLEIEVEFDFAESMPRVLVDPVQIQQVILNLVRNSMEAFDGFETDNRRIVIATRIAKPGSIEVSVADSGPGLAIGVREKIFDSFVTTKSEGLGIGLSICRSIVEAHGGELLFCKESSAGTMLRFVLPSICEGDEL